MGGSPRGTSPRFAGWPPPGAFPPSAVRRDRLWVGLERLGGEGGSRLRPRALQRPLRPDLAASRGRGLRYSLRPISRRSAPALPRSTWLSLGGVLGGAVAGVAVLGRGDGAPCSRRDCRPGRTVLSAPQPRRVAQGGDRLTLNRRQGSAAMLATHPTRLETRTKESNARASQRVPSETPWRNESEGRRAPAEVGSRPRGAPGAPPARLAPHCRRGDALARAIGPERW